MPPRSRNLYVAFGLYQDAGRESRQYLGGIDLDTGQWDWAPEPGNIRTAAHFRGETAARRAAARWGLAIRDAGYTHGTIKIRKHNT
jgi:hypothetical protein